MSLIVTDGFETYANFADMATRWVNRSQTASGFGGASASITPVTGRYGGSAMRYFSSTNSPTGGGFSANVYTDVGLGGDFQTIYVGGAFWLTTNNQWSIGQFHLLDANNTLQVDVRINPGPVFYATRGGTTLCTANRNFFLNTWVYVELAVNISTTAGWLEIWQDGILVASYYGTGTSRGNANGNTQAGLATARLLRIGHTFGFGGGGVTQTDTQFDDLYVCNSLGSRNNNLLGDIRIGTLYPTGPSADGAGHTQWARSGSAPSSTNWQSVDEPTNNQDTDYIFGNNVGLVDTYTYSKVVGSVQSILGVVAQPVAKKDDAGQRSIQAVVRQSNSDAFSPTSQSLTSSYAAGGMVMEVNPVTGLPWTIADINVNAEFGVRISA